MCCSLIITYNQVADVITKRLGIGYAHLTGENIESIPQNIGRFLAEVS